MADFSNEILIELGQREADEKVPSNYNYKLFNVDSFPKPLFNQY